MKQKTVYHVKYMFYGVNYEKDCTAYDFNISCPGCLTLYFNGGHGRMVMASSAINNFEVTCTWKM